MAEPKRRFTARDAYNLMMRESASAREDYEAAQIAETIFGLANANAGYQGSSAQAKNKAYINSLGKGVGSGSSSRYKMLQDADKEDLSKMFTDEFNTALPGFTSIMDFNKWATKMGDWYQEDLRAKHSTIVRNALTGRKDKSLEDEANKFLKEYGVLWNTGGHENQNVVTRTLLLEYEDHPYGALIIDKVDKQLKQLRPRVGKYFEADEARKVAGEARSVAGEERNVLAGRRLQDADYDKTIEGNFLREAIDDIEGTVAGIPFADQEKLDIETVRKDLSAKLIRAGIDTTNAMQTLDEMYGTREQEIARGKAPGTKQVYDLVSDSTIFATEAEIADNKSLVPTAAESNLDADTARIGADMVLNDEMPNDIWKKYYKGGMDLFMTSLGGPDKEHLKKWWDLVMEYKEKSSTDINVNYGMLRSNESGQATGQTDDGITGVRVKK